MQFKIVYTIIVIYVAIGIDLAWNIASSYLSNNNLPGITVSKEWFIIVKYVISSGA